MAKELTLIFLKPDAKKKNVLPSLLNRFEEENIEPIKWFKHKMTEQECDEHYAHVSQMPFYKEMKEYILSDELFFMILRGEDVVQRVREIIGPTRGAQPGTIRGDFGSEGFRNLIHASDSYESVVKEMARFY